MALPRVDEVRIEGTVELADCGEFRFRAWNKRHIALMQRQTIALLSGALGTSTRPLDTPEDSSTQGHASER